MAERADARSAINLVSCGLISEAGSRGLREKRGSRLGSAFDAQRDVGPLKVPEIAAFLALLDDEWVGLINGCTARRAMVRATS